MSNIGDMRPVPEFNGKYWCTKDGLFFRMQSKAAKIPTEIATSNGRVRFYFNGVESRPMIHKILERVWGLEYAERYESERG